jgi:hypothetical protein
VDVATGINRHFPAVCNIVEHDASSTEQLLPSAVFPIKINGRRFHALLDSGASISLIKQSVADKLGVRPCQSSIEQATGITGHSVELLGQGKFNFKIGRKKLYRQAVHIVESSPYDLIVGLDLLYQLGSVTLNFHKNHMYLYTKPPRPSSDPIPIDAVVPQKAGTETREHPQYVADDVPPEWNARVLHYTVIPPRSHVVVKTHCAEIQDDVDVFCRPAPRFVEQSPVLPAHVVTTCDSDGYMKAMLLNSSSQPFTLRAGTTVLKASPVSIPLVCNVNAPSFIEPPEIIDPLKDLDLSKTTLTDPQKEQLVLLLYRFQDCFAKSYTDLGCFPGIEHEILTGDHPPIKQRPYRIPISQRAEVSKQIDDLLKAGIIEHSNSPWSSPLVVVPKPSSGQLRLCCDLRKLNAVTVKDVYPLPLIDDVLDKLYGAKYFSSFDLQHGFWQIKVREEDKHKTAMITPDGLYQFVRLPMGLANSPAGFQRAMNQALLGLQPQTAMVYLDDIIVKSNTFDQHLKDIALVLERMRTYNLKLKTSKCTFAMESLKFLGHIVSSDGLRPDPSKVSAIRDMAEPEDVKGVRRFIGCASYYRKFIAGFATMARPLFTLLKKEPEFAWTPECQTAFDALKIALTQAPVLVYANPNMEFCIETDASGVGIGGVLTQASAESKKQQPIAYTSRVLQGAEKNYSITELECLAIIHALKVFRHWVLGVHCTVITDHKALKWLMTHQSPNGRLTRWALSIQEFDLAIEYRPGAINYTADALSRAPLVSVVLAPDLDLEEFKAQQRKDPQLKDILDFLENELLPPDLRDQERRQFKVQALQYEVDNGALVLSKPHTRRKELTTRRMIVPLKLQSTIIKRYHDSNLTSHPGIGKTRDLIQLRYHWKGMRDDIDSYVSSCDKCQKRKPFNRSVEPPLQSTKIMYPFALVGIDIQELPVTYDGNRYLLVIVDYFSKWIEAFPMADQKSATIAKAFMTGFVCRHGVPYALISDKGANLLSEGMKEIYQACNIRKYDTAPYSPQSDGLVENCNKQIQEHLAMLVEGNQRDWDDQLPFALFALRNTMHLSTGETPYYLLYGQDPFLPLDRALQRKPSPYLDIEDYSYSEALQVRLSTAWDRAQTNINRAQAAQKTQHDKHVQTKEPQIGKFVVIRNRQYPGRAMKLGPRYSEPHIIYKIVGPALMLVPAKSPDSVPIRIHMRNTKPYKPRVEQENPEDQEPSSDEEEPLEDATLDSQVNPPQVLSLHTTVSDTTVPPFMKLCKLSWSLLRLEYNSDPNFWENVEELLMGGSDDYEEEFALVREHVALWEAQDKIKASNQ